MKFKRISEFIKINIVFSTLIGGILLTTLPLISHYNNPENILSSKDSENKIKTGKIIHSADTQVVSSVNNIVIETIAKESNSRSAIVNNNGVQEFYVWGDNRFGQLGIGSFTSSLYPVKFDLAQFGTYDSIEFKFDNSSNDHFSNTSHAIVTENGIQRLYLWGQNQYGQLGLGDTVDKSTPNLINSAILGNYSSIDSIHINYDNVFIITNKIIGSDTVKEIYGSGANTNGQLVDGSTANSSLFKLIHNSNFGNYIDIIKFMPYRTGTMSIIVNTSSGQQLYVWGQNTFGQLGLGNEASVLAPQLHPNALFNSSRLPSMQLLITDTTSYAWDKTLNELYTWGRNNYGQLGLGDSGDLANRNTPTLITNSSLGNGRILDVDIGMSSSSFVYLQIANQFSIYVWGRNDFGQLGLTNSFGNVLNPSPFDMSKIGNPTNIKDFYFPNSDTSNGFSSYAIVEINNALKYYVWGQNNYGQLAIGNETDTSTPQEVNIPQTTTLIDAWLFNGVSSVIVNNNGLIEYYVCGNNGFGQLGIGNTTNQKTMIQSLQVNKATEFLQKSNSTYNISSTDEFNKLYIPGGGIGGSGSIDKFKITKYINIVNPPEMMELWLTNVKSDFVNGILDITFIPTFINPPLLNAPIPSSEPLTFSISGFKKVSSIKTVPVAAYTKVPTDIDADKLWNAIANENGTVKNYALLSKYVDLTSIPPSARIRLVRIPNDDKTKLDFTFYSNEYYNENGATTFDVDANGIRIEYKANVNIKIDILILPWALIIGSTLGGIALLLIIIFIIVKVVAKRRAVNSFGEYLA